MSVFNAYSAYYDLLYRDKNYQEEANYIDALIKKYAPNAQTLIDFGCGTGSHCFLLEQKGYQIDGVDMSATMLEGANTKKIALNSQVNFHEGDFRTVRLDKKADIVTSLFHVMSYQTSNTDLEAAINTAKTHLNEGGTFIFDCWYGAGVLTTPPSVRVKKFEDNKIAVTRIGTPEMYANENCVDVNFTVFIQNKEDNQYTKLEETHKMRYLFAPEMRILLEKAGFKTVTVLAWLSVDTAPTFDNWYAVFIAQ